MSFINLDLFAKKFAVCPVKLEAELDWIKERYIKKEKKFNEHLSSSEYDARLDSIEIKSKQLKRVLAVETTELLKKKLDTRCIKEVSKGDEEDIFYEKGFVDDLVNRLNALIDAVGGLTINVHGNSKQYHKAYLARDFRTSWKRLTGSDVKVGKGYRAFLEGGCKLIDIDPKGMWKHHEKTRPKQAKK